MPAISVEVGPEEFAEDQPSLFADWIIHECEGLIIFNRRYIQRHRPPPLYSSGVVYRREPKRSERFRTMRLVYGAGHGDCEDLASIRCAEYRERGINARIRITWQRQPNGRLWHVTCRLPDGTNEDPSKRLGM